MQSLSRVASRPILAALCVAMTVLVGAALLGAIRPALTHSPRGDDAALGLAEPNEPESSASTSIVTITVDGIVTGPSGPVPDVWVGVGSPLEGRETTTNESGYYSVTLQTDGYLRFEVYPKVSTRLAQHTVDVQGVTGDLTKDFALSPGYLLSLRPTGPDGEPVTGGLGLHIVTLLQPEEGGRGRWCELRWDGDVARFEGVLIPDVYLVGTHNLPPGYYNTSVAYDVRTGDLIEDLPLPTTIVSNIPYEPPDASRITIGPPDDLGEASVSGAPGAVLRSAIVWLANLNAAIQVNVLSEPDGSFSARVFAPPGSTLHIKHGYNRALSSQFVQERALFPGTNVNIPHTHPGDPGTIPFAAAGAAEDYYKHSTYVDAAWSMTGTVGPMAASGGQAPVTSVADYGGTNPSLKAEPGALPESTLVFSPGDWLQIDGMFRIYGPAITATTDISGISVAGGLRLLMIYNQDGQPVAATERSYSNRMTPTGFPIKTNARATDWLEEVHFEVENLHYLRGHTLEGEVSFTAQLEHDLLPGIYRPYFQVLTGGFPTSTEWVAVGVDYPWGFEHTEGALPPIVLVDGAEQGPDQPWRLIWRLLMDDPVQGNRGTGAREDEHAGQVNTFVVAQGAPCIVPPIDERSGQAITYRLEPFLPRISTGNRDLPHLPIIPFAKPGGQLTVEIRKPDGTVHPLGTGAFAQSFMRSPSTPGGRTLNDNTGWVSQVYSLMAEDDRFRVVFDQFGHHVITMTGGICDIWGNTYTGGGTYDVWVAYPLDIDPGVLPGTPLAVGDAFDPAMQFYPRVPAEVELTLTLYPDSDPAQAIAQTVTGWANPYGYFSLHDSAITMTHPGEYRVDLTAAYTATSGEAYMGAMTWGGVVMTPPDDAHLVAHGRRGTLDVEHIPNHWFMVERDLGIPESSHIFNPYFNGDIIWSARDALLLLGASVQDIVGDIEPTIQDRADRMYWVILLDLLPPGTLSERFEKGEIPLFTSTLSGRPARTVPAGDIDQIAYSYQYSERPGVRVRELVAEDPGSNYWNLESAYEGQLGAGGEADLENDFKFQYVGAVYRDLETGRNEYLGQGTGWIHTPDETADLNRVMPPFSGPGNGGWTTEGGPILTLKGEDIHIFIMPTGTRPGAVLEVSDVFRFAGHIMPTLDSQVAVTVTAPSETQYLGGGQANHVGYFYDPDDDFVVDEPGLWSVLVRVWHDGLCSGGATIPPFPSGDVLGSERGAWSGGRYYFYVVPADSPRLQVSSPTPGFLSFASHEVNPISITGSIPSGLSEAVVDYTVSIPGYILEQGQVQASGSTYEVSFDPVALHQDFPNLDLKGTDLYAGLADTIAVGLLLRGESGGATVHRANTITIQGEQVYVRNGAPDLRIHKTVVPDTDVGYHGEVTYTVILSNAGPSDAEAVVMTDTLPVEVDFAGWVEQPDGGSELGDEITWLGTVASGEAITFTFVVTHTGDYGEVVTNTAECRHTSGSGSDAATFVVEGPPSSPHKIYLPLVLRSSES